MGGAGAVTAAYAVRPRTGRAAGEERARPPMIDAVFYALDTECKWRSLPADLPPGRRCTRCSPLVGRRGLAGHHRPTARPPPLSGGTELRAVGRGSRRNRCTSPPTPTPSSLPRTAASTPTEVIGRKRDLLAGTCVLLIADVVTSVGTRGRAGAALTLKAARAVGPKGLDYV